MGAAHASAGSAGASSSFLRPAGPDVGLSRVLSPEVPYFTLSYTLPVHPQDSPPALRGLDPGDSGVSDFFFLNFCPWVGRCGIGVTGREGDSGAPIPL